MNTPQVMHAARTRETQPRPNKSSLEAFWRADSLRIVQWLVLLAGTTVGQRALPIVPQNQLRSLERVVLDLHAAGRTAEARQVTAFLTDMGYPKRALERIAERVKKAKPLSASRVTRALSSSRRTLQKTVATLGKMLRDLEAEQRTVFARALLGIDGSAELARLALGHVREDGSWRSPASLDREKARARVVSALQQGRRLEVPVEVSLGSTATLRDMGEKTCLKLTWNRVTMFTNWPAHKAKRIMQQSLRALALTNWATRGRVEIPTNVVYTLVLLDSQPAYHRAARLDQAAGRCQSEVSATSGSYFLKDQTVVSYSYTEAYAEAVMFCRLNGVFGGHLLSQKEQPCLVAGHASWVCAAFLGVGFPLVEDASFVASGARTTSGAKSEERMLRLRSAGLMGCRAWLRELASRNADPPLSRAMRGKMVEIENEPLLKSLVVAEFLQEQGRFTAVLKATSDAVGRPIGNVISAFEVGLGQTLSEFEATWRVWLADDQKQSVVERLGRGSAKKTSASVEAVARRLAKIRAAAFVDPTLRDMPRVVPSQELSAGALLHARYLARNPAQAKKWPDVHEQFADRDGFSPAGSWAAQHSVIIAGSDAEKALDAWMATFYHRLPLLEPGLLQFGWGLKDGYAVLDCSSVVREVRLASSISWPPDGMTGVPTRFAATELPHPVPGEDQTKWGYPITLQVIPDADKSKSLDIQLELREQSAKGSVVPCHFLSPKMPKNPHLVPDNAFCLIPKYHLRAETRYVVSARGRDGKTWKWSFKTGR